MMDWLPLFPLGQPLFPGLRLELQIFEQRYLKLIRSCLREADAPDAISGFGICAIQEGREAGSITPSIYDCGARVEIVDWNQLPNGLLGITVEARERFWIGEQEVDPDGLLRSAIEFFEEEHDEAVPEWASGLAEIYEEMLLHPEVKRRLPVLEQVQASGLGFGLAQILPMHQDTRMDCFRTCHPLDRLELIADQVQTLAGNS